LELLENSLSSLSPNAFSGLTNLVILSLGDNSLTSLPSNVFNSLTHLVFLNLTMNSLYTLPSDVFSQNIYLLNLWIPNNHMKEIQPNTFSTLRNLQYLQIQHNSLTTLPPKIFDENINLLSINARYNNLTSLPDRLFDNLLNINSLYLQYNSLAYIDLGKVRPEHTGIFRNSLISFSHDSSVLDDPSFDGHVYCYCNCLNCSHYYYKGIHADLDCEPETQYYCPAGSCSFEKQNEGCAFCDGDVCVSCLNNYILHKGECIPCVGEEECKFNNTNTVNCTEDDLEACTDPDYPNCYEHVCVSETCGTETQGELDECQLGGEGCWGCKCMSGWYPSNPPGKDCISKCGDNNVVGDEQCEKGGLGCNDECKCISGYESKGEKDCGAICHDGIVNVPEECDSGLGCNKRCMCDLGWYKNEGSTSCKLICGDGYAVRGYEQCDRTEGCDDECMCEKGYENTTEGKCKAICGDGILAGKEECDSSFGCDRNCHCTEGWKPNNDVSCKEVCGDGLVVGSEECDSTPGCSNIYCVCEQNHPYNNETKLCSQCGNKIVEGFEECDGGKNCADNCKCENGYELDYNKECMPSDNEKDQSRLIPILGAILGVLAFFALIILVLCISRKKCRSKGEGTGNYFLVDDPNEIRVDLFNRKHTTLTLDNTIWEGNDSTVYKAKMGDKIVVVKTLKRWETTVESQQKQELEILQRLSDPFVAAFYGIATIENTPAFVMEFCPLGSLEQFMMKKLFSPELKMRYARDICMGMKYLHSVPVVHRNLKLSNVLVLSSDSNLRTPICKISDFACSREIDTYETISQTMTSFVGTPLYMAPELLSGKTHYSQKTDVYSYGILLAGLWNQQQPFSEQNLDDIPEMLRNIVDRNLRPKVQKDCPEPYLVLMRNCWSDNPHERPTFEKIATMVFSNY